MESETFNLFTQTDFHMGPSTSALVIWMLTRRHETVVKMHCVMTIYNFVNQANLTRPHTNSNIEPSGIYALFKGIGHFVAMAAVYLNQRRR